MENNPEAIKICKDAFRIQGGAVGYTLPKIEWLDCLLVYETDEGVNPLDSVEHARRFRQGIAKYHAITKLRLEIVYTAGQEVGEDGTSKKETSLKTSINQAEILFFVSQGNYRYIPKYLNRANIIKGDDFSKRAEDLEYDVDLYLYGYEENSRAGDYVKYYGKYPHSLYRGGWDKAAHDWNEQHPGKHFTPQRLRVAYQEAKNNTTARDIYEERVWEAWYEWSPRTANAEW